MHLLFSRFLLRVAQAMKVILLEDMVFLQALNAP